MEEEEEVLQAQGKRGGGGNSVCKANRTEGLKKGSFALCEFVHFNIISFPA